MRPLLTIAIIILSASTLAHSSAEELTAESLAGCMMDNSGVEESEALKNLLIDALSDAPREKLQTGTIAVGMQMLTLATVECGMGMEELSSPLFEESARIYGQQLGEKLVTNAMAKIG